MSDVQRSEVNAAIRQLARKDRATAITVLEKFGAINTAGLKRADYQAVLDLANEKLARFAP